MKGPTRTSKRIVLLHSGCRRDRGAGVFNQFRERVAINIGSARFGWENFAWLGEEMLYLCVFFLDGFPRLARV